jgi:uncharacterized protein YcbK (DUF882 family)
MVAPLPPADQKRRTSPAAAAGWVLAATLCCAFPAYGDGEHVVREGQSLTRIARRYGVSIGQLAAANRLEPNAALRVGQRLVLPGSAAAADSDAAERRWGKPRRPGVASLYRPWSKERRQVRLVDVRGRIRPDAVRALRHLLRPKDSARRRSPAPRLLQLLARVSDRFGGRPIHLISGVRLPGGSTNPTSRHVTGHAIDFRIPGVPLEELRDFCARFERVGVGFYPQSGFVHLDVRERSARWTDTSGPGEPSVPEDH